MEIIGRSLPGHFITLLLFLLIFTLLSLSSICIDDSNALTEQQQTSRGEPVVIVPGLMDNVLTLVSFLFLGCFFVLGLRIQSVERTRTGSTSQSSSSPTSSSSSLIDKYFLLTSRLHDYFLKRTSNMEANSVQVNNKVDLVVSSPY